MSIKIERIDQRILNYPLQELKEKLDIDLKEAAENASFIENVEETEENTFKISTCKKTIMKKDLSLKTTIKHTINKEKGMILIKSQNADLDNFSINCKLRAIEKSKYETIISINIDASINFGFPKFLNKAIQKQIEKEIEKLIKKSLSSLEKKGLIK